MPQFLKYALIVLLLGLPVAAQAQMSPAALAAAALLPAVADGANEVIAAGASKAAQAIDGKTVKANQLEISNRLKTTAGITASGNSVAEVGAVTIDNIDSKTVRIDNETTIRGRVEAASDSLVQAGVISVNGARVDDLVIEQDVDLRGSVSATNGSLVRAGTIRLGR